MSFHLLVVYLILAGILWILAHSLLMAKPITGIPHNTFTRYMPWGDLIKLGIHNWTTGGVFDWFSLQCLNHKSPVVQIFIPSFSTTRPTLVLADLREIEDVVTKRIGEIDRADAMHMWFGLVAPRATIGLKSKNPAFKEQRRLWNLVLSPKFLQEVAAERFYEVSVKLARLWQRKSEIAGSNLAFEALLDVKMATLDGIWKMNVGSELELLDYKLNRLEEPGPVRKERNEYVEFADVELPQFYATLGSLLMCLDWVMQGISPRLYTWFFVSTGILERAMEKKNQTLDHCITTSRRRIQLNQNGVRDEAACTLDQLFWKEESSRSSGKTEGDATSNAALRDELLELLITGHETTASSIAWALKYLTSNPEAQAHLRASLYETFPSASPSHLPSAKEIYTTSIPYLEATVAETLRLSMTGPVSFRQTIAPCDILGHAVPTGTPIVLVTAGPSYTSPDMPLTPEYLRSPTSQATQLRKAARHSRSPLYGSDFHVFDPSRWIQDGVFDPDAVHMLPFSAGPRGCFGKKVAMLELKIMLAVLMMRFEFPQLTKSLSRYGAVDGLTRRPTTCYVRPHAIAEMVQDVKRP